MLYEYTIRLPHKIERCSGCPIRIERMFTEQINCGDSLNGTVSITRRNSFCPLLNETIEYDRQVNDYMSKCPLKDKCIEIKDESSEDKKNQRF